MRVHKYLFGLFILIVIFLLVCIAEAPDKNLHIVACNVGQVDAILTVYGNVQILTDGGPDNSVLTCLGRHLPFWDRQIEMVISTHSDADHSFGLIEVFKRYKVDNLLINPIDPGTQQYLLLKNEVRSRATKVVNPYAGQRYRLGLIYLDIYNPTKSQFENKQTYKNQGLLDRYLIKDSTNDFSVVYKLNFGKFNGLFMGDSPSKISDLLAQSLTSKSYEYIKIPHHGSSNGLTQNLLEKIESKVAVISVGRDNLWGFPSEKVLNFLKEKNIKVYRTDEIGDVEVVTDGNSFRLE